MSSGTFMPLLIGTSGTGVSYIIQIDIMKTLSHRKRITHHASAPRLFLYIGSWAIVTSQLLISCENRENQTAVGVFSSPQGEAAQKDRLFDLEDIQQTGELIILTLYGPTGYFEFRGENFGSQYLLADAFARSIGCSLRVDVCRSNEELEKKLSEGEGDIVAIGMDADRAGRSFTLCGTKPITHLLDTLSTTMNDSSVRPSQTVGWMVRKSSTSLAEALNNWLNNPQNNLLALSMPRISGGSNRIYTPRRHPHSPMLNASAGIISHYDGLFKRYARECRWDWRLLAAQAYQESAFDTEAVSWMGALGLMQLMPSTAREMGVPTQSVLSAEPNIQGAVRLISKLDRHFSYISNPDERINFILAAYNAGAGHVEDARTLATLHGQNPNVWYGHVETIVLRMSQPRFYNDPHVRHGYFRGAETFNYVRDIRARWQKYKLSIR